MYPYKEEKLRYKEALDRKHPETDAVATKHHAKQTHINMTFDTVEDVAGFANAVFKGDKDKLYKVEPNFLNPRKNDELFRDHSANCTIM
ncbi:unnamed protein product [Mucor hiemalis]